MKASSTLSELGNTAAQTGKFSLALGKQFVREMFRKGIEN
jgi:hypothetical protein